MLDYSLMCMSTQFQSDKWLNKPLGEVDQQTYSLPAVPCAILIKYIQEMSKHTNLADKIRIYMSIEITNISCQTERLTFIQTGVVNRLLRSLEIFCVFIFMYCPRKSMFGYMSRSELKTNCT